MFFLSLFSLSMFLLAKGAHQKAVYGFIKFFEDDVLLRVASSSTFRDTLLFNLSFLPFREEEEKRGNSSFSHIITKTLVLLSLKLLFYSSTLLLFYSSTLLLSHSLIGWWKRGRRTLCVWLLQKPGVERIVVSPFEHELLLIYNFVLSKKKVPASRDVREREREREKRSCHVYVLCSIDDALFLQEVLLTSSFVQWIMQTITHSYPEPQCVLQMQFFSIRHQLEQQESLCELQN